MTNEEIKDMKSYIEDRLIFDAEDLYAATCTLDGYILRAISSGYIDEKFYREKLLIFIAEVIKNLTNLNKEIDELIKEK